MSDYCLITKHHPLPIHTVQSLCILANSNLSLTFLVDKGSFETFSINPKFASLIAFLTISTHTSTLDALLSSHVAFTTKSIQSNMGMEELHEGWVMLTFVVRC
jgi:hypothetical protein